MRSRGTVLFYLYIQVMTLCLLVASWGAVEITGSQEEGLQPEEKNKSLQPRACLHCWRKPPVPC